MTITLHLPPELEEKLKEQAKSTGKNPEEIALDALQENLSDVEPLTSKPSIEKKLKEFHAWVSRQRSRNPNFDDSRESIYSDRSECQLAVGCFPQVAGHGCSRQP